MWAIWDIEIKNWVSFRKTIPIDAEIPKWYNKLKAIYFSNSKRLLEQRLSKTFGRDWRNRFEIRRVRITEE